jgi:predicted DNA-binding transcriptional regulator AlpA
MTELQTITHEVALVMSRAHPPAIMNLEDVAVFLGYSRSYVVNDVQNRPDFPPKLDRFSTPRWKREDVMGWAGI